MKYLRQNVRSDETAIRTARRLYLALKYLLINLLSTDLVLLIVSERKTAKLSGIAVI